MQPIAGWRHQAIDRNGGLPAIVPHRDVRMHAPATYGALSAASSRMIEDVIDVWIRLARLPSVLPVVSIRMV